MVYKKKTDEDRKFIGRHPCIICKSEKASAIFETNFYCKNCYNKIRYESEKIKGKLFRKRIKERRKNALQG